MKKTMNYEAPVAEMIELNAAFSVMTGSPAEEDPNYNPNVPPAPDQP